MALATVEKLFDKTMANVREVKARGAHVLGVTTEDFAGEIEKYVDRSLIVPKTHPLLQPSLTVIPLQAFAYYIALARGCDVDMPRNLAKSVTVEEFKILDFCGGCHMAASAFVCSLLRARTARQGRTIRTLAD